MKTKTHIGTICGLSSSAAYSTADRERSHSILVAYLDFRSMRCIVPLFFNLRVRLCVLKISVPTHTPLDLDQKGLRPFRPTSVVNHLHEVEVVSSRSLKGGGSGETESSPKTKAAKHVLRTCFYVPQKRKLENPSTC